MVRVRGPVAVGLPSCSWMGRRVASHASRRMGSGVSAGPCSMSERSWTWLAVRVWGSVWMTSWMGSPPVRWVGLAARLVGNTEAIAWVLYRDYLLPFEVASVFLLVAMIGAVVLGMRSRERMD